MANIVVGLDALIKKMTAFEKKQVPFALSLALNNTANLAKVEAQRQMPDYLDRPTRFTINSVAVVSSKKTNLVAKVLIKDIQAKYLGVNINGGAVSKRIAKPVNIPLNKFGNIRSLKGGKKIKELMAKGDAFIGDVNGVNGLWLRANKGTGLKLLVRFEKSQQYDKKYPFKDIVIKEARKNIEREFSKAMTHAVATAFK